MYILTFSQNCSSNSKSNQSSNTKKNFLKNVSSLFLFCFDYQFNYRLFLPCKVQTVDFFEFYRSILFIGTNFVSRYSKILY